MTDLGLAGLQDFTAAATHQQIAGVGDARAVVLRVILGQGGQPVPRNGPFVLLVLRKVIDRLDHALSVTPIPRAGVGFGAAAVSRSRG